MNALSHLVSELAGRPEERLALSFYRGRRLVGRTTHRELAGLIHETATGLGEVHGVRSADRVALLLRNQLSVPVATLALMHLGATVVPLNPTGDPETWRFAIEHARVRGLITTRELGERVPALALEFVQPIEELSALRGSLKARPRPRPLPAPALVPPESGALGIILYTSGTTGRPKGVGLTAEALLYNARAMAERWQLEGATQLAVLPLYHAHALGFGLLTALVSGGHLVFTDGLDPLAFAEVIRAEGVEVASATPNLLPLLMSVGLSRPRVPTLRSLLCSSAPLSTLLAEEFETRTEIPLCHGWGLSEYTNFACCLSPALDAQRRRQLLYAQETPAIGPALMNTEVTVRDGEGRPVGEGDRGELWVRGPSAMVGYLDDPAATRAVLSPDGWLRTGDEGCLRRQEEGPSFFVTGRLKEILIRDGEKVSPAEVERRLFARVPELEGALVVLGFEHRLHGEEVGAYVALPRVGGSLEERLLQAIATLVVAERPKVVLFGDAPLPRTHTGKLQRRALAPLFVAFGDCRGTTRLVHAQCSSTSR